MAFYNRKPVVVLPRSREANMEDASIHTASTDELDRHVHDVLKRKNKFRRVMKGVWAFLKTREWNVLPIRLTHPNPILLSIGRQ
jgi:hypothetical protein